MPDRIQLRRTKGWTLPADAINVARPSRYGNPFKIGAKFIAPGHFGARSSPYHGDLPPGEYSRIAQGPFTIGLVGDRNHAVALFVDWIQHEPAWKVEYVGPELAGHDLACWCPPPEPGQPDICHAAATIAWVNGGRLWTPEYTDADGVRHLSLKRCCNGCGDPLGDVVDSDIVDDGLTDVRWECPRCSELLRSSRFETAESAVDWMREQTRAYLISQGADWARLDASGKAEPKQFYAYLVRRVLPDDPSILADLTSAALLLGEPLPTAGDADA